MSRAKLRNLEIELPMLPATSVGSFPKPPDLLRARADFAQGKVSRNELEEAEKRATEFWIRKQEELGVDYPLWAKRLEAARASQPPVGCGCSEDVTSPFKPQKQ